jgi:ABC-type proline/glycine betaine transport system substrate-binding protein
MKGLVTILIFVFAVGFTASACAGEAAPKTQATCEKAGMDWDGTASARTVKCHFRLA